MIKVYHKTATIMAEQFDGSNEMIEKYNITPPMPIDPDYTIDTLEGDMVLGVGDWIATGINGEHWVILDDVFKKTYAELPVIPKSWADTHEGDFGSTDEGNHSKVVQELLEAHKDGQKVKLHGVLSQEDLRDLEGLGYLVNHDFNLDEDTYNNFWLQKIDTSGTKYRTNVAKLLAAYAFGEGCAEYELNENIRVSIKVNFYGVSSQG